LVFGAFQREELYLQSAPRWQELARTADACFVFADFGGASGPTARPVRIPLDRDSPLLREWAVVVHSAEFSTVLTGWEVPAGDPDGQRWFETIFTFEPEAIRVAVATCLAAARSAGISEETVLRDPGTSTMAPPRTPTAGVDALMLRAFTYLQDLTPPR
jgi:MerR family transcriptional regulator, light-induced transcriptional regulator